mgnify:CR=1 FL=1
METDWIWGLAGGGLIGMGGAVYLLGNGRVMGASGILGGLVDGSARNTAVEKLVFLAGVILLPLILQIWSPVQFSTPINIDVTLLFAAGTLVGIGLLTTSDAAEE